MDYISLKAYKITFPQLPAVKGNIHILMTLVLKVTWSRCGDLPIQIYGREPATEQAQVFKNCSVVVKFVQFV